MPHGGPSQPRRFPDRQARQPWKRQRSRLGPGHRPRAPRAPVIAPPPGAAILWRLPKGTPGLGAAGFGRARPTQPGLKNFNDPDCLKRPPKSAPASARRTRPTSSGPVGQSARSAPGTTGPRSNELRARAPAASPQDRTAVTALGCSLRPADPCTASKLCPDTTSPPHPAESPTPTVALIHVFSSARQAAPFSRLPQDACAQRTSRRPLLVDQAHTSPLLRDTIGRSSRRALLYHPGWPSGCSGSVFVAR